MNLLFIVYPYLKHKNNLFWCWSYAKEEGEGGSKPLYCTGVHIEAKGLLFCNSLKQNYHLQVNVVWQASFYCRDGDLILCNKFLEHFRIFKFGSHFKNVVFLTLGILLVYFVIFLKTLI